MTDDPKSVLRTSPLLSKLSDEELDVLLGVARRRTFADGDRLTQAGSSDSLGMWIILDGTVAVSRDGRHLATLGPGEHVGEMALMSDIRRSADVVAQGDVEALQLAKWDLRGIVADHPDIVLAIIDAMAARLAEQNAADGS